MRTAAFSLAALLALAGCGRDDEAPPEGNAVTVEVPRSAAEQPGVTPMAERVAVLGLLNKRNGIVRDIALRPGQSVRVKDVVIRLRACETTAPWESEALTGAFVQLDVELPDGRWQRVFSGWLYKESPSLNVIEHPVYDVAPKSCAMTYPAGDAAPAAPVASSNRSSARNSGAAPAARAASVPHELPSRPASSRLKSDLVRAATGNGGSSASRCCGSRASHARHRRAPSPSGSSVLSSPRSGVMNRNQSS